MPTSETLFPGSRMGEWQQHTWSVRRWASQQRKSFCRSSARRSEPTRRLWGCLHRDCFAATKPKKIQFQHDLKQPSTLGQSSNEAGSLQKLLHLILHQKHRQDQNQKQNLPESSVFPEAPGIAVPPVVVGAPFIAGASFIAGAPVVTCFF